MLGNGIRRNVATVSEEERTRLRDAFVKMHGCLLFERVCSIFRQRDQVFPLQFPSRIYDGAPSFEWSVS